ncbi:MAG: protein kinase [Cyanobacteria bacterium J007]|nr:MAG: protein kinase [Cyanobacteria bacterium J007]
MRQCFNPECLHSNPENCLFCQKCGHKLLLVERYWAKKILGQGGFGRTFLAIDDFKPSKPTCVIKQFLPQTQGAANLAKAYELFDREARRLEELGKHPQIPELFGYFSTNNKQYLVQEFIEGETLQQELEQHGVFNENKICELLKDLLTVLKFVHHHHVIHRDIKPDNIIRRSRDRHLVLVDFGASKYIQTRRSTAIATVIGSAEYCAPEQAMGKAIFASDLYSLGVTCLYLLTHCSSFDLYDVIESEWIWREFLNSNPVSKELGNILDRLVEPKPKYRYQSVDEVLKDFQSYSTRFEPSKLHSSLRKDATHSAISPRYYRLDRLLSESRWKEADYESGVQMFDVIGKDWKSDWLSTQDLDEFPAEDLRTIDELWLKYSQGKFGFSIQKKIYHSLGGTRKHDRKIWRSFCDEIGWRMNGSWLSYSQLPFSLKAPPGNLPGVWLGFKVGYWSALLSRTDF